MLSGEEKKISAVLDIDGMLGTGFSIQGPESAKIAVVKQIDACNKRFATPGYKPLEIIEFFLECDGKNTRFFHVLHPGAKEFAPWLLKNGFDMAFFSGGGRVRNDLFVKEYLSKTGLSDKIKPIILSREDRNQCEFPTVLAQATKYGMPTKEDANGIPLNPPRKKLNSGPLKEIYERAVLVDDDISNIYPGEEKHALIIPTGVKLENFCLKDNTTEDEVLKLNNIFQVVGMLKTAMNLTQQNEKSFFENLFDLQYETIIPAKSTKPKSEFFKDKKEAEPIFVPIELNKTDKLKYCEIGLQELQIENPHLKLYGQHLLTRLHEKLMKKMEQEAAAKKTTQENVVVAPSITYI